MTTVTKEEVFKVAEGANDSSASAYCLLYVSSSLYENKSGMCSHLFLAEDVIGFADEYSNYLTETTRIKINRQNKSDNDERDAEAFAPVCEVIYSEYRRRYNFVFEQANFIRNNQKKFYFGRLTNFAIFLLVVNELELGKWYIFDGIFTQQYGKPLKSCENFNILNKFNQYRMNDYILPILQLSFEQDRKLKDFQSKFEDELRHSIIAESILENANNNMIENCTISIYFLFMFENKWSSPVIETIQDPIRVYITHLYYLIIVNVKTKNINELKYLAKQLKLVFPYYYNTAIGSKIRSVHKKVFEKYKGTFSGLETNSFVEIMNSLLTQDYDYEFIQGIYFQTDVLNLKISKVNIE